MQSVTRAGEYVAAGGLRTYYEVHGTGDPLVLLHGGLCTVETLDGLTPGLAEQYTVYTPERRGHGRTPDVPGPLTYQNMAADTVAWMEAVGLGGAHLVGFSDGGNVALEVARSRPDLVTKLVVMGAAARIDGYVPEQLEVFRSWQGKPSPAIFGGFKQLYGAVSPDGPDHFEVMFAKSGEMWQSDWSLSADQLAGITAPALVLLADDDVLTVEHAAAMARELGDAQLAVVPGTSHGLPFEKPELVNRLLLDFLAAEQVPRMMSMRALLAEPA